MNKQNCTKCTASSPEVTLLKKDNAVLRDHIEASIALLKTLQKQVGTVLGEDIDEHIALLQGRKHDAKAWDMSDRNGEQGI